MSNVKIPRTPHISVPVRPGMQRHARRLCKKFATVLLSEVGSSENHFASYRLSV